MSKIITNEIFQADAKQKNSKVTVLGTYTKMRYSILVRCNRCGKEYFTPAQNVLSGKGCRFCAAKDLARTRKNKLKYDDVKTAFEKRGYTLLTEESDSYYRVRYLCPIHGEQQTDWSNFRAGKGCPECAVHQNDSKVARGLKEYCKKTYPDTITEYKIVKNPETGRYLPYDIYVPSEKLFCEVMGQQHYKEVPYFQRGEDAFKKQFEHDNIKEDYAVKHGRYVEIDLRRIKTVDEAIEYFESLHNSWISKWAAMLDF